MKNALIGAFISVGMLFMTVNSFAAVEQTGDFRVCISGNTGTPNTEVGIQIFKEGNGTDDLEDIKTSGTGDLLEVLVFQDQEVTDENGIFKIYADIYMPSGKYTVYSGAIGSIEYEAEDFVFVNYEDFKNTAKQLNEQTSALGVKEIVMENQYVLGLTPEAVSEVDADEFSEVLYETLKETPFDENNRTDSWGIAKKALFVQRLNEGKIENIYDEDNEYSELFKDGEKLTEWVLADFVTEKLQKGFTDRLSEEDFKSYGAYKDSLIENFVLSVILNPNGTDNIKDIVSEFEYELGVDADVDDDVWSKIAGNDYADKSELKQALKKYNDTNDSSTTGSGGSSGGSGSGNKKNSGAANIVTMPARDNKIEENRLNPVIFDDLEDVSWAQKAIVYLAEKQIINGVGNGKFNPNGKVTREQFVKIAVGAFLDNAQEAEVKFDDVKENEWYAPYIKKAYSKNVVNGMGDGNFGVGLPITRQDMCVMIYKAANAAGYKFNTDEVVRFADDGLISDYAKEAVYALKEAGAVSGVTQTEFMPQENATRAQAAKIIHYIMTKL